MENEKKIKKISIILIILSVIGLTIAFAAMSYIVKIKGSGNIDPANFDIHFKNVTFKEKTPAASISGTPTPSNGDKGPTIKNLEVTLALPGDYVEYTADIENEGDIDAEINYITPSTLTASEKELFEFIVVYTNSNEELKTGDTLAKGEVRNITMRFKYKDITDPKLLPDTPKTIKLSYSIEYVQTTKAVTQAGSGEDEGQTNGCTQFTKKDNYSKGDIISICNTSTNKSEDFYVLNDNGSTVTAIAKYNLLVGSVSEIDNVVDWNEISNEPIPTSTEGYGLQSSQAIGYYQDATVFTGVLGFADSSYWTNRGKVKSEYGGSYPAYIYDENCNLWSPVQNYVNYLVNTLGKTSVTATILSYEQALENGCNESTLTCSGFISETSHILGTVNVNDSIWVIDSTGDLSEINYDYRNSSRVRPVITINKSEL